MIQEIDGYISEMAWPLDDGGVAIAFCCRLMQKISRPASSEHPDSEGMQKR